MPSFAAPTADSSLEPIAIAALDALMAPLRLSMRDHGSESGISRAARDSTTERH